MKAVFEFIKTTVIGGLVVIVPITIVVVVLAQLLGSVIGLTEQLAAALPFETLENPTVVLVLAVLGIVLICFLTGLLLQTTPGEKLKQWLSQNLSERVPMYGLLLNLTKRLVGMDATSLKPAEIDLYGTGTRVLGFLVEKLPEDRAAVFVPSAPVATVGQVYVVPARDVYPLDASMADMANSITQWGVGAKALYKNPTDAG